MTGKDNGRNAKPTSARIIPVRPKGIAWEVASFALAPRALKHLRQTLHICDPSTAQHATHAPHSCTVRSGSPNKAKAFSAPIRLSRRLLQIGGSCSLLVTSSKAPSHKVIETSFRWKHTLRRMVIDAVHTQGSRIYAPKMTSGAESYAASMHIQFRLYGMSVS